MSSLFSTRFMEIYQFCLYPTVGEDCIYFCSSDPFPTSSDVPSVGSFPVVFFLYRFFSFRVKVWHSIRRGNVFPELFILVYLTLCQILTLTEDICKNTHKHWKNKLVLPIVYGSFNHYFLG